jgi:UDP-MurNAc hydroxylase
VKITKICSSTIIIEDGNTKILCDPWIENGEYYGSWSLNKKINIKNAYSKMNSCDAIYISHIHPDHLSSKTMSNLLIKSKAVFIHSYAQKFLKKKLEFMGFQNIIELSHGEKHTINGGGGDTKISIYAADNCNPKICRKFYACNLGEAPEMKNSNQIDSCMVLQNKKFNIVNLNDCMYPMMSETIKKIKKDFKKIDLLLVNYNSAHAYPQCIDNYNKNKKKKISDQLKKLTIAKGMKFINDFQPNFFIPFAGEYLLSGKLYKLNQYAGMNSEDECYEYFKNSKYSKKLVMLNYGKFFDLEKPKIPNYIYNKKNHNKKYLKNISSLKFTYEKILFPSVEEIEDLLNKSFKKFKEKLIFENVFFNEIIFIKYFNKYAQLDLKKYTLKFIKKKKYKYKHLMLSLDERLLMLILKGPRFAHWNNADIGSHINYFRSNPKNFNYRLGNYLSYFHS